MRVISSSPDSVKLSVDRDEVLVLRECLREALATGITPRHNKFLPQKERDVFKRLTALTTSLFSEYGKMGDAANTLENVRPSDLELSKTDLDLLRTAIPSALASVPRADFQIRTGVTEEEALSMLAALNAIDVPAV